jgi:hypothetical protein
MAAGMIYRVFLTVSQVLLVVFLLGGFAVVIGQTTAIVVGSASLMQIFGSPVADTACMVAAGAGISAFLLRYTKEGRESADEDPQ